MSPLRRNSISSAQRTEAKHIVKTFGEAMDSGDKATNKAMSAAYKYACFKAFSIPTEGDNDADATAHGLACNCMPESVIVDYKQAMFDAKDVEALRAEFAKGMGCSQTPSATLPHAAP